MCVQSQSVTLLCDPEKKFTSFTENVPHPYTKYKLKKILSCKVTYKILEKSISGSCWCEKNWLKYKFPFLEIRGKSHRRRMQRTASLEVTVDLELGKKHLFMWKSIAPFFFFNMYMWWYLLLLCKSKEIEFYSGLHSVLYMLQCALISWWWPWGLQQIASALVITKLLCHLVIISADYALSSLERELVP